MSQTASYRPLSRLRSWQTQRQITRLLHREWRDDVTIGRLVGRTGREEVFEAYLDDQLLEARMMLGPEAAMRARAELDVLDEAAQRLGDGNERVTRILWANPASGLLVTEIPSAPPLGARLGEGGTARNEALGAAARWLSTYAGPTLVTDRFGGGFWIRQFSAAIASLPDRTDQARLAALIEGMRSARAGGRTVTRARCHGDFRPAQFWAADGVIWARGLRPDGWGAVLRDVARFVVDLSLASPEAASGDNADLDAFVRGLSIVPEREIRALLPYFTAVELAGRLLRATPADVGLRVLIDNRRGFGNLS